MRALGNFKNFDFEEVPTDPFWNSGDGREPKMHRIHSYPAKFPAFITTKALEFAQQEGFRVQSIADIFCGCGTTALEARRNSIDYWGCDINPVATLIAEVKSNLYRRKNAEKYLAKILESYQQSPRSNCYRNANPRLKYWFKRRQFNDLNSLKFAIESSVPKKSKYLSFFLCAFSNVLKPTSVWLTKSIKPQVDPDKRPADVLDAFLSQCKFMLSANSELEIEGRSKAKILNANFLSPGFRPQQIDLIITSPPYVTSYEYADLHQLSSLWLNYANDYRELRKGSIGSLHQDYNFNREWKRLNATGNRIVSQLLNQHKEKARAVTRYYLDMQETAKKTHSILNENGIALFVIGNTEYKGVRIDNAKHLAEAMHDSGFKKISATKRKISRKILTPYRDERGKFSANSNSRKVYSEEFILVGRK